MPPRMHTLASTMLLVGYAVSAAAADSLEEVEKKILARWETYQSFTAKISTQIQQELAGRKASSNGSGTVEFLRRGDDGLFRIELTNHAEVEVSGQKTVANQTVMTVFDGQFVYTLTTGMGRPIATKSKPDAAAAVVLGKGYFKNLRSGNDVKLLPAEELDGHTAHVIEARPKKPSGAMPIARSLHYFRKDNGVLVKVEARDQSDKTVQTTTYSAIRLNPAIDEKRFDFKVPAGVTLMDSTKRP